MSSRAVVRLVLRIGVVLLVLAGGIAGNVLLARGQSDLRILVVGGALVTLVGFVALDSTLKRIGESSARTPALDDAADALAEAVRQQWEAAARERGLIQPTPIPVRWQWTRSAVVGPVSEAIGSGTSQARFPPLPGMVPVGAQQLASGRLQDLLVVYAGIDSGRIVIIGDAGTGKTGTAILLLLDALKYRERLPDAERKSTPVPVLLNCRGWDPARTRFPDWLVEQLNALYGFLGATEFGVNAIERLVAQRRMAIFLDGFDEIPHDLRPAALGALNIQAHCRLVLLSRSRELVDAVRDEYLVGAAALELMPVARDEAADYLARCRVQPSSTAWERLIAQIRTGPETVIADALNSPLTLTLVRDTFQIDADTRLLAPDRFSSSEAVEEFLLDRVVPAAYAPRPGHPAPRYTCEQAQRWLQYVARQLNAGGTRDLAWWQVPAWQPAAFRAAANGLVAAFAFGAIGWITFGSRFAAATGFAGAMAGSLVGAFAEWRPDTRPVQLGALSWRALGSSRNRALNLIAIVTGLGYGGIAGIAFGVEGNAVLGFGLSIATFLAFQLALAVSILIAAPSAEANSPIGPLTAWRRDRAAGIAIGTVFGIVFGTLTGTTFGLSYGFSRGAAIGGIGGLIAGMAIALTLVRSWDSRLAFLQIQIAGHGPARLMDFLEDARQRGVLRTVGPVYQFRHARLQDRLAA